jgi:hypothetical protein
VIPFWNTSINCWILIICGGLKTVALLDTVERLARDLGYDELFMNTSIPGDLVERRASQPGFSNRSIAG